MRRPLIIIFLLFLLFVIFFYFSLGTRPKIVGEEVTPPTGTTLDSTMQSNPVYNSYVYVKGAGYVLRDRRIVLLVGKDAETENQANAIKHIEEELESYWKWKILTGSGSIEELSQENVTKDLSKIREKSSSNFFSRIIDVFKVADAVNVIRDTAKTCDCDNNLILLAGKDLHLIETTLNPGGGGIGSRSPSDHDGINEQFMKQATAEPQIGGGNTTLLVGVIDSGVNFGNIPVTYKSNNSIIESLITPKMNSSLHYNFVKNTKDVSDPNSIKHGTKITRIIVNESINENIKIVGLKAYDENNIGNLYDNLCAILYATKNNIKLVNASWGASHDTPIPVFEEVLKRAKAANVVVVCSAGNKKEDIDLHPYYPACYADHPELGTHVVTVSSKNGVVCQNFSSSEKKIDLTVDTDADCNHSIPSASGGAGTLESGTSYAAPYVTSGIAKYMLAHPSGFSKSGYITSLPANSIIKKYHN